MLTYDDEKVHVSTYYSIYVCVLNEVRTCTTSRKCCMRMLYWEFREYFKFGETAPKRCLQKVSLATSMLCDLVEGSYSDV